MQQESTEPEESHPQEGGKNKETVKKQYSSENVSPQKSFFIAGKESNSLRKNQIRPPIF